MNLAEFTLKQRSEGLQKSRQFSLKAPAVVTMTADECKSILEGRDVEYLPGYEGRVLQYTVTDESQDSYGDIIRAQGAKLERYLKNPVVLYAHQGEETPVGRSLKIYLEKQAVISQDLFLDERVDKSGRSDLIYRFAKSRMMPGVSISFMPIEANVPTSDEERKAIGLGQYGIEYKLWEKLEHSPCSIPSNPNALLNALKSADLRAVRFEQRDFDLMVAWKFMELNCIDAFAEGLKKKYKNVVFSIPKVVKAVPVMVTCKECQKEFEFDAANQDAEGYMKCPGCGTMVNMDGDMKPEEDKRIDLILSELKSMNERLKTPVAIEEKSFNEIITKLQAIETKLAALPSQRSEASEDKVHDLYSKVFGL